MSVWRQALDVVDLIDSGVVSVTPLDGPHRCYTTHHFAVSNGWEIALFCDGGFDYIESMVTPVGEALYSFGFDDPAHIMGDGCERCNFSFRKPLGLRQRFGFDCDGTARPDSRERREESQ